MDPNVPATIAAVATICAAIISASVAFLGLIISKEQKVSEFRQNWIDALRGELAEFLSSANSIAMEAAVLLEKAENRSKLTAEEINEAIGEHIREAYPRFYKIVLRLNPKEHKTLLGMVEELERTLSRPDILIDHEKFTEICAGLSEESHRVLKYEWNRVKNGEPEYRGAKIVSAGVAGFLLIFVVYVASIHGYA